MEDQIINKVAQSGLVSIDLEELFPPYPAMIFDIKDALYEGIILKEKEFRAYLKKVDWKGYGGAYVGIHCSADAIVPTWAYMLVALSLEGIARKIMHGGMDVVEQVLWSDHLQATIHPQEYLGKKVVVKGCSKRRVPECAYIDVSVLLHPYVQSLMYGEPCSTVPLYKKIQP